MRDYADLNRRLADLIVGFGANVQPGQIVGLSTYTGKEQLAYEVVRSAYEHGAKWVDVLVSDPWAKRASHARQRRHVGVRPSLDDGSPGVALG
jgi:aminopeptidase